MDTEIELFRKFLTERGYPESLVPVECAWVSCQPKRTATKIMENVLIVEEYLDGRRESGN